MMMQDASTPAAVQRRVPEDSVFDWLHDFLGQHPAGVSLTKIYHAAERAGVMSYKIDGALRGHTDFSYGRFGGKHRWFLANNPRAAWKPRRP